MGNDNPAPQTHLVAALEQIASFAQAKIKAALGDIGNPISLSETPSAQTRPAWMPDLDGKYRCDGCGTVLHHNGHCDCTWNRRLVPIEGAENPAPENQLRGKVK